MLTAFMPEAWASARMRGSIGPRVIPSMPAPDLSSGQKLGFSNPPSALTISMSLLRRGTGAAAARAAAAPAARTVRRSASMIRLRMVIGTRKAAAALHRQHDAAQIVDVVERVLRQHGQIG